LDEVLQEDGILCILSSSLLAVEVFAEDGALAGKVMFLSGIENRVQKSFEQVQAYTDEPRIPQETRGRYVPLRKSACALWSKSNAFCRSRPVVTSSA
jgi:hypothetical protein